MPRLALYALVVCLLAVAAAVVSFVQGQLDRDRVDPARGPVVQHVLVLPEARQVRHWLIEQNSLLPCQKR